MFTFPELCFCAGRQPVCLLINVYPQGSFPVGTPANGVPKVILTVGTAFPGIQ